MSPKSEVEFWRHQFTKGKLLKAIRADRERVIQFFGAKDVVEEDEWRLMSIVDAYEILNRTDEDLAKELGGWMQLRKADTSRLPLEMRNKILKLKRPLREQVLGLKAGARRIIDEAKGSKGL